MFYDNAYHSYLCRSVYYRSSENLCSSYSNLTITHHPQLITLTMKLWAYPPAAYYQVITISVYAYFITRVTIKYTIGQKQCSLLHWYLGNRDRWKTYGTNTYKNQDLNYTHYKQHTWIAIWTFTHNLNSTATSPEVIHHTIMMLSEQYLCT